MSYVCQNVLDLLSVGPQTLFIGIRRGNYRGNIVTSCRVAVSHKGWQFLMRSQHFHKCWLKIAELSWEGRWIIGQQKLSTSTGRQEYCPSSTCEALLLNFRGFLYVRESITLDFMTCIINFLQFIGFTSSVFDSSLFIYKTHEVCHCMHVHSSVHQ